jgi:DNA-binding response OmpR family regulator
VSADAAGPLPGADHLRDHDAYIVKPFRIEALLAAIADLTGLGAAQARSAAAPRAARAGPPPLPVQAVEDLLNLARIGYANAFSQRAEALRAEAATSLARDQFDQLIGLAQDMNFDAIVARLENARHER